RGMAALGVVFFHFTLHHPSYETYFRFGTIGVDLFFMISGFVIFMSLQKADSIRTFITNRLSRLYPAYWMGVLFSFALITIHFHYSAKYAIDRPWLTLAGNLTMVQYYLGVHDLEGPYWTMIVELIFYVLMGLIFFLGQLKRIHIIGSLLCTALILTAFFVDEIMWVKDIFIKVPLLYHFPLFYAGIVFYERFTHSLSRNRFLTGLAISFAAQMALFPHTWRACKHMSQPEYAVVLLLFFTIFYLFIGGKLERISNPVTLFFGKISFPLYLTHQYLSINLLIPYFMWKHEMTLPVASLLIALPCSVAVATVIHYTAETHGSRILRKWLRKI
ncbi:MAG: acyltransferase family protein, partial [Flavobacteriales bacterium]